MSRAVPPAADGASEDGRHVAIRVTREFPFPRDEVFAWLTDFQDSDTERAGAVLEARKVVERAKDRVVYEGETRVLGRRSWARTEVTLLPPDRWSAAVTQGLRAGSRTFYSLVPVPRGSRLTVDYRFTLADKKAMLLLRLAKPLVRRDLAKMWAGFAAAMEEELRRR